LAILTTASTLNSHIFIGCHGIFHKHTQKEKITQNDATILLVVESTAGNPLH
jgi:hypothetical protein